ncbi:MAG: RNA 3'-terminal phosphate cyclase, partial [Candidatus Micrarchaeota archaeon]
MKNIVQINGSYGEGGGQILRTSLALSAVLQKPLKITNIRANRPKPGLSHQHLCVVDSLSKLTGAKVSGATLKSQTLEFSPMHPPEGGKYIFDIKTAGSTILLAQALLPALIFAKNESNLILRGGTHVPFAPSYDY